MLMFCLKKNLIWASKHLDDQIECKMPPGGVEEGVG